MTLAECDRSAERAAWQKHGDIFTATGKGWMRSHAALPTVLTHADRADVYFCARDAQSRSQIGRFALDPLTRKVTHVSRRPLLEPGPLGAFDDSGVMPAWVVNRGDRLYLYYTGWMVGKTVPFYYAVGLAVSHDGGVTFQRMSRGPLLERNNIDPFLTASPCVMFDRGLWRMWYVSGERWEQRSDGPRHYYHIRYAESGDGIRWQRDGHVCVDFAHHGEYAIARPTVLRDRDRYRMWFPHRGDSYRIGYAESADGLAWNRMDDRAGIDVSDAGWDSEMVTYPCVFDHAGRRYMLYNGNGYGRTGIGLAEQELPHGRPA